MLENLIQLKSPQQIREDRVYRLERDNRLLIGQIRVCQIILRAQGFEMAAKELENTLNLLSE